MSMSDTDPGPRSAAEIEREVEQTRAGLTNTLDALRERASPSQLFEQAVDYVRSSGGDDMVRNLGQQVRDNPLPLLLIGAGIGWLMLGGGAQRGGTGYGGTTNAVSSGRSAGAGARFRVHGAADDGESLTGRASAAMGSARDSVAGAADQAIDKAGQAYRSASDAASSAAGSLRDTASSVADSLRGAANTAAERVGDATQDMRHGAAQATQQAQQGIGWLMREQPLVLGAIGIALGAAVGALLPGTEAEDRLMGETRDQVADRVQSVAQEGYERVKDKAGEHLERVQGAVSQASGQAGGIGAALTGAAREVRGVVRDAAQDLAGEARNAMGEQPKREEGATPKPAQQASTSQSSPRVGPT
ncbi:DUF3618 domain-containing protein [Paracraurococcus lichenis]|uniref:DUF3618 domain-containing protein n=1 Tax=Paracraurococcus lichenis TaxID=3064888 RepID=A0ABT9DSD6_9PROT|nr:DUF3618 domain-containing protein [Paracraurococcus sp. LOR1-02]MDO9706798.1 DUF3618 domain-containing protein [Paracraurococcus sp. LOR1-02]